MNLAIKKRPYFYLVLVTPAILIVASLVLYPLINGFILSFTNETPLELKTSFVGWSNYEYLFEDDEFWTAVWNSMFFVGTSVGIATVVGYILAVILNQGLSGSKYFRIAIFQVWVLPWVVVAILWGWLFSEAYGLINYLLLYFGIINEKINFLFHPNWSQWIIIGGYSWRSLPFMMVVCLAALQSVPKDLIEAAKIDGASFFQVQRIIVIPMIKNIILVAFLLQCVRAFQEMTMIFVLTNGGPINATLVLSIFTYKLAFQSWDFGTASAVGMMWLLFMILFAIFFMKFLLKRSH